MTIPVALPTGVISIEHVSLLDDEAIQLMKDRGTYPGEMGDAGREES